MNPAHPRSLTDAMGRKPVWNRFSRRNPRFLCYDYFGSAPRESFPTAAGAILGAKDG